MGYLGMNSGWHEHPRKSRSALRPTSGGRGLLPSFGTKLFMARGSYEHGGIPHRIVRYETDNPAEPDCNRAAPSTGVRSAPNRTPAAEAASQDASTARRGEWATVAVISDRSRLGGEHNQRIGDRRLYSPESTADRARCYHAPHPRHQWIIAARVENYQSKSTCGLN
jgi:hypothetical protein